MQKNEIINGKLQLVESPFAFEQDKIKLYCRECGEELINADELISA